jgi:hypothetical protein
MIRIPYGFMAHVPIQLHLHPQKKKKHGFLGQQKQNTQMFYSISHTSPIPNITHIGQQIWKAVAKV